MTGYILYRRKEREDSSRAGIHNERRVTCFTDGKRGRIGTKEAFMTRDGLHAELKKEREDRSRAGIYNERRST